MLFGKTRTLDGAMRPRVAEQLVSLCAPESFAADQYRTFRLTIERRHRALRVRQNGDTECAEAHPGRAAHIRCRMC